MLSLFQSLQQNSKILICILNIVEDTLTSGLNLALQNPEVFSFYILYKKYELTLLLNSIGSDKLSLCKYFTYSL